MPDTPTPRLALYKSEADGSELVNYTTDIAGNLDKIDNAVGFLASSSSARPSSPWSGQAIREADTGRYRVWDGSAWTELANTAAAPTFTAGAALTLPSSTGNVLAVGTSTDTVGRLLVRADGRLQWGSGSAAVDTLLYRAAAGSLKTDTALTVGTDLTIGTRAMGRGLISHTALTQTSLTTAGGETTVATVPSTTLRNGRAYVVRLYGYAVCKLSPYMYFRLHRDTTSAGSLYVGNMRVLTSPDSGLAANVVVNLPCPIRNSSGADITVQMNFTAQIATASDQGQFSVGSTSPGFVEVRDVGLAADYPGHIAVS